MFETENKIDYIQQCLAFLSSYIKQRTNNGAYDINIECENFFCHVLNILRGWQLENLNIGGPNHPAIDLGDTVNSVAVQVTSDSSLEKVRDTITKYYDNGLDKAYRQLFVLILGDKVKHREDRLTVEGHNFYLPGAEIDFNDLGREIAHIAGSSRFEQVYDCFRREIPIVAQGLGTSIPVSSQPTATMGKNYRAYLQLYFSLDDKDIPKVTEDFSVSMGQLACALSDLNDNSRSLLCTIVRRRLKGTGFGYGEHVYFESRDIAGTLRIPEHELCKELGVLKARGWLRTPDETGDDYCRVQFIDEFGVDALYDVVTACERLERDVAIIIVNLHFDILD